LALRNKAIDLDLERTQVVLDDIPDEGEINTLIAVDEPVPERDYLSPNYVRRTASRGRQSIGSFSNDLEIANDGVLDQPLAHEGLPAGCDVRLDGGYGVSDMRQVREITLHKG
jgi:hypothetical protein